MSLNVVICRIVHYVLDEGIHKGDCRPLIMTKIWNDKLVNGTVLPDSNDELPPFVQRTSVVFDPDHAPGTWHWPHDHEPSPERKVRVTEMAIPITEVVIAQ